MRALNFLLLLLQLTRSAAWQPALLGRVESVRFTGRCYTGSLLGVNTEVRIYTEPHERAVITLKGPLIGRLSGVAWIDDAHQVTLDDDFQRALARRRVAVEGVGEVGDHMHMWVRIYVPLIGFRTVLLRRVYA